MAGKGSERRRKGRVRITHALIARFGAHGAVVFDISDSGARIEHFGRLEIGRKARFRVEWHKSVIETEAVVVSCKLHRFASGEEGGTVYQTGLSFIAFHGDAAEQLKELVSALVARSLAEQVANARGLGPVLEKEMPVFREGVVADSDAEPLSDSAKNHAATSALASDRGYLRCTLIQNRYWQKKWTRRPDQPSDGFTVSASEPADQIDRLCDVYLRTDEENRHLIQVLARMSIRDDADARGK